VHGLSGWDCVGQVELIEDGLCVVAGGKIVAMAKTAAEAEAIVGPSEIIYLKAEEFCCPGFIDTHVHAPQYQFTGRSIPRPGLLLNDDHVLPRVTPTALLRTDTWYPGPLHRHGH